jgi:hypothetical protein
VARLVPFVGNPPSRALGAFQGKIWMSNDALELPAWLLDAFEGGGGAPQPPAPKRRKR